VKPALVRGLSHKKEALRSLRGASFLSAALAHLGALGAVLPLGPLVDVRVELACAFLGSLRAFPLGVGALRALLGLGCLAACTRRLLIRGRLLTLATYGVRARVGAVLAGLGAQPLRATSLLPLRGERQERDQHQGSDYQQNYESGIHFISFPRTYEESLPPPADPETADAARVHSPHA
jgi:hypothetical protein